MIFGAPRMAALNCLTTLRITGPDARAFLQGQLSSDVRKLTPQLSQLTCCSSAQGRVQAVATLVERDASIQVLVATATAARLLARLRGYVLRSRVALDIDPDLTVAAVSRETAGAIAATLLEARGACVTRNGLTVLRWWSADERYLLLAPRAHVLDQGEALNDLHWRQADIAAGVPHVYPQTHEFFVAQMLNLDVLGGISFDKGCYAGQEIIARTHYRGTLKRRMLYFGVDGAAPPAGTRVLHQGTHAGEVVDACVTGAHTGHSCELLAVISLDRANEPLELDGRPGLTLQPRPLPYPIPHDRAA
jgi:tRNA-modifying protein YgfZ